MASAPFGKRARSTTWQSPEAADIQAAAVEPGTEDTVGAAILTVQTNVAVPVLEDARFTRDMFAGQTVPILAVGAVGKVWVRDVTARAGYADFWSLSTGDYAAVNPARPAGHE